MKTLVTSLALALVAFCPSAQGAEKLKLLILDGQNNHDWRLTTPVLRAILLNTGRFDVDVSTTPSPPPREPRLQPDATAEQQDAFAKRIKAWELEAGKFKQTVAGDWAAWRPKFGDYAVVLSNYNGEPWPDEVKRSFADYVRNGGGFVSVHAANNAFPEWPEYNEMIGLGGWGGRNEKSGPYLRLRNGAWVKDDSPGQGGGHGAQHEFLVELRQPDHPIVRGLPAKWMHAKDELYHGLRGPASHVLVLASALSDKSGENEPMLMAINFGKGRVFHTVLGHSAETLKGAGFQETLARGTEWAATGAVTLPAPNATDLPADKAGLRELKTERR